jgi:zinc protease
MSRILTFASLLLFILSTAQTQTLPYKPSDRIPVDPSVIMGRLDNGMVYYIKQNNKPENRIELRLAVNAGSILETEGQQGLAHFLEHMCFNGTKNFPKNELVSSLQKMGVEFGADINAYTSFDETVYMLQVPADNDTLINEGFQILEDWAHQVSLDGVEIDKERGVIIEEWRMGLGANDRLRRAYLPVMFSGSKYADRLPIGKPEIIQNFPHDTIRAFYSDWYRPDLQAIVVVGDIDPKIAEAKIKQFFGNIPVHPSPKPRPSFDVPGNTEPLVVVATDKEATNNMLMLFYKHPKQELNTIDDLRRDLIYNLYTGMLNNRLSELNQKASSPFLNASAYYGRFLSRSMHAYLNQGVTKSNQINAGLEMLVVENQRVKQFGFLATELERQKASLLSLYERAAREADKTESGRLAMEYVGNYLSNEPIPGAMKEFQIASALMPGITLEEVNSIAKTLIRDDNMVLVVTAPDKEGVTVPGKAELLETISKAKLYKVDPWVDTYRDEPLVNTSLKGSKVKSTLTNENTGVETVTLKNGIKIHLKKTDYKNDEVLFMAVSPGGYSLYPACDFMSHSQAASIVSQSGIGKFSNIELQKKLKGKVVSLNPFIGETSEGFRGNARPADLELMMQMLYLNFTEPRFDAEAFNAYKASLETRYQFMGANPTSIFFDTLMKVASSNSPRTKVLLSPADLAAINHQKAYDFFRERFANGADFTYMFVGNFDKATLIPLLETYIGSLPVSKKKEKWNNLNEQFPAGKTEILVNAGTEPKAMVGMLFSEKIDWTPQNRLYLSLLKEILDIKITEVIREEMSGVYSPSVSLNMSKTPEAEFSLNIMFGCSPGNTDNLTQAVMTEISKLIENGPGKEDLVKAKETMLRKAELDVKTNRYWLDKMYSHYYNGDPFTDLGSLRVMVESVTIEDLKSSAAKHFSKDHYVRGVLLPAL